MNNKNNENDPLKELHEIREKNYEETKHMTAKEYVEHVKRKFEKIKDLFINKHAA